MLCGAALGAYHAGVEWRWWPGPTDCSGPMTDFNAKGSLLNQLQSIQVVRCDEAAWRLFGLSLAGYNVLDLARAGGDRGLRSAGAQTGRLVTEFYESSSSRSSRSFRTVPSFRTSGAGGDVRVGFVAVFDMTSA